MDEDPYDLEARLKAWIRIWYTEPPDVAIELGCAGPLNPDRQLVEEVEDPEAGRARR